MIVISIGIACDVKYQIDKIFGSKETLFFDWLMTDMESVNNILSYHNNINDLLFYNNVIQNPNIPTHNTHARIIIKSLSMCESIHDIFSNKVNKKSINEFIDKYKRRFNRIITYIKNNENISFIRHGEITYEQKLRFIEIIKEINPNCKFILGNLVKSDLQNNIISQEDNYICININKYIKPNIQEDWTNNHFDWKTMLYIITNQQNNQQNNQNNNQNNNQQNNQQNNQNNDQNNNQQNNQNNNQQNIKINMLNTQQSLFLMKRLINKRR
jgi:hypothetical protein